MCSPNGNMNDMSKNDEAVAHDRALSVPCCLPSSADRIATADSCHIFLTGATGFLGANVLSHLLQRSCATIHCLIRRNNLSGDSMPLQRIVDAFVLFRLEPLDTSRIQIVQGDLALPLFGLSPSEFERLSCSIDCVFHVCRSSCQLAAGLPQRARAECPRNTYCLSTSCFWAPQDVALLFNNFCGLLCHSCSNEDDALSEAHCKAPSEAVTLCVQRLRGQQVDCRKDGLARLCKGAAHCYLPTRHDHRSHKNGRVQRF
jgi:hypothetical protein